jgi:hypothetical protein
LAGNFGTGMHPYFECPPKGIHPGIEGKRTIALGLIIIAACRGEILAVLTGRQFSCICS